MSIVRKKAVTIDGAEFVIGSLTMRQVETIVAWSPEGKTVGELKTRPLTWLLIRLLMLSLCVKHSPGHLNELQMRLTPLRLIFCKLKY